MYKIRTDLGLTAGENNDADHGKWVATSRRVFLKSSVLAFAGLCIPSAFTFAGKGASVRFGLLTDSHYAVIDPRGTRHYTQSVAKMTECIDLMNDKKVDFLVHLGDLINGAPSNNVEHLRYIEGVYAKFNGPRYHVLGNHDMDKLSKAEVLSVIDNYGINKAATYYTFDSKGMHFIILDSNYRADGSDYGKGNFQWTDANIPDSQIDWLDKDLESTTKPVIVCTHQLLDNDEDEHTVRNASEVRSIFEKYGNVLAVFQGHQHRGQYNQMNEIHYYTLKAMVEGSGEENNSYAIIEVLEDQSVIITGYRRSVSHELKKETTP